ncbi:MAG: hypothetical protein JW751_17750 [Polyangiaceae bacterium]|nr:hypothetical protein [Polyangiaceae bacterium]
MNPANTTRGNVTPKASATESVAKVPADAPVVAGTAAGSRKPAAPAGAEAEAVTLFAHTSLDAYHLALSALVKGDRIAAWRDPVMPGVGSAGGASVRSSG